MNRGNSDTKVLKRQGSDVTDCVIQTYLETDALNTDQRRRKMCISSSNRYLGSIYHMLCLSQSNRPLACSTVTQISWPLDIDESTLAILSLFLPSVTVIRNKEMLFDPICYKDLAFQLVDLFIYETSTIKSFLNV